MARHVIQQLLKPIVGVYMLGLLHSFIMKSVHAAWCVTYSDTNRFDIDNSALQNCPSNNAATDVARCDLHTAVILHNLLFLTDIWTSYIVMDNKASSLHGTAGIFPRTSKIPDLPQFAFNCIVPVKPPTDVKHGMFPIKTRSFFDIICISFMTYFAAGSCHKMSLNWF